MNSVISYFLRPYTDASFMRQQQARIFLFFIGGAFLLLVTLILAYVFIVGEAFLTGSSLIRFMYCVLCFICLLLLRNGHYGISTNLAVYCCIILSLVNSLITAKAGSINTVTILYFFFIFIVMATVFGTRLTIILSSALNIGSAFFIIVPSSFEKKEKLTILIAFIMAHLFVSLLCYLYQVIVKATIMKMEEHSILTNVLDNGKHISSDLKGISDKLKSENQSLSQRTTQQASAIQKISESLESAMGGLVENAGNTDKARELASETTAVAKDGATLLKEAVNSINEISSSSQQINKITTILNEVAFQTNLLSINGAIEAAHAGENGKGFGIVAGAVRNLAVKSHDAAQEIGVLVADSISKIEHGMEIITNSGTVFTNILASIESVNELIQQIAYRSQEQRDMIEQISQSIGKIDLSTRENSEMAENTSTISDKLSERAFELTNLLQGTEGAKAVS